MTIAAHLYIFEKKKVDEVKFLNSVSIMFHSIPALLLEQLIHKENMRLNIYH